MRRVTVAIGIVVQNGRVLICQRGAQGPFAHLWEFPGGKIEPEESPECCVRRELLEELEISVVPGRALPTIEYDYPDHHVTLRPFLCEMAAGCPRPRVALQARWVLLEELAEYSFPAANQTLIAALSKGSY